MLVRALIFKLDAFATRVFTGNPAAVVVLPTFPADTVMQAVAAENNLSETAFLVQNGDDYRLRWFTPKIEVPLCGHATLASAAVVMERLQPARQQVIFHSASGPLTVQRTGHGYCMNFPARPSSPIALPGALLEALHVNPVEVLANQFNYMALILSVDTL